MDIIIDIAVAVFLITAVMSLLFLAGRLMMTPVKMRKDARITAVLSVKGDNAPVEAYVKDLLWTTQYGKIDMDIVISDEGLSPDLRRVAETCAKENRRVLLCDGVDIQRVIEENRWTGTTYS